MTRTRRVNVTRQQLARITAAPARPLLIEDGIEVTDTGVWAWVEIPATATYLLEEQELVDATLATSTALAATLPPDTEFHIKIVWRPTSGAEYARSWADIDSVRAPLADQYIALGGERIDANAAAGRFRQRVVLLGVRWPDRSPTDRSRQVTRILRSASAELRDAGQRCDAVRPAIDRWMQQVAEPPLRGRPASAGTIAWAYARELRRGVDLDVPDDDTLSGGRLVSLMDGQVDPTRSDNYVVVTDARTGTAHYVAVLTTAVNGFPPSELEIPGGEWLQVLADLDGVEASLRGVNHGQAGSVTLLDSARKLITSQERESTAHGGQPPTEVLEADQALRARRHEVTRRLDVEITTHPRWVVDAATEEELTQRVDALRRHYAGTLSLHVVPYTQDLLWQELLPGDTVRVTEFAQLQPMRTLAGSWFHGGSVVGDTTGPYIGANLGSTPDPVRFHLTSRSATDKRMPTSVAFTGQSGSGKSTAVMLTVLGVLAEAAWCLLVDGKGDLGGIVEAAHGLLGVPVQVIDVTSPQASGSMDPMRFAPDADEARSKTLDVLLGALHPDDRRRAETVVEQAIDAVLTRPRESWSSPQVVSELVVTEGDTTAARTAREIGEILRTRSHAAEMRVVLGALAPDAQPMLFGRGLVYVDLSGLPLPRHSLDPVQWSPSERCAMAVFRLVFAYALLQSRHARSLKKLVALTELHLITRYPEGRAYVEWTARTGRALQTAVALDTQDADGLAAVPGLVEQLVTSFAFRAEGEVEQAAQAALARRPNPGPVLRAALAHLDVGQAIMRDRHNRLAPVQFDLLSEWLRDTLATDAAEDTNSEVEQA